MMSNFDYMEAFSRNIGWLTCKEQETLRTKKVAIAGMGGVGGIYVSTLARLGVSRFVIADSDVFELGNFNRQVGATIDTIGKAKTSVMSAQIKAINPEAEITVFAEGIHDHNREEFLSGANIYVDGLDFFELPQRRKIFALCRQKGIPAVTVAPVGMGAAVLAFLPDRGLSFEEYFRFDKAADELETQVRFLVGLSPSMIQRHYLADPSAVDFIRQKVPSTIMGCTLCAGIAATYVLKLLLGRGLVKPAPWGMHFDAYKNKMVRTWRPGGNENPLQKMMISFVMKKLK